MRPWARRIRLLLVIALLITFALLYLITARRTTRSSLFYSKTRELLEKARQENDVTNAMANAGDAEAAKKIKNRSPTGKDRINDAQAQQDAGQGRLEDTLKERLRLAEIAAKQSADQKWKGVTDAARKARQERKKDRGKAGDEEEKKPNDAAAGADERTPEEADRVAAEAADAVVKIMREVKRSVTEEVQHENAGEAPVAAEEVEKSKEKVEALISEVSPDKIAADELRKKIVEAREREKAELKAQLRKQLKKREMDRQIEEGKKLKAIDPEFFEKKKKRRFWQKAAKAAKAPRKNPTATTKPVPIPTTPAEVEFHKLLALSPVTVFSKSYCPYSRKAKRILTQAFDITPSPYVVELDRHAMGAELQAILLAKTSRKTVPNVIIAGKSIGGGDEVEQLWESGKLRQTIKKLAGRRIAGVIENEDIMKRGWRN